MPEYLTISSSLWQRLVADVQRRLPEEACGLLAGIENQVLEILPVENVYHSPSRYRMDPQGQLKAFNDIDKQNWDLLAIYHSHPDGPGFPSSTDINEAYYPDAVYVIISRDSENFQPRGFIIKEGKTKEIPVLIES